MSFLKPTPFVDYVPARLSESKEWVVVWYVKDPVTNKMIRCRKKFNRIKQLTKRRASAKAFINTINERLALGWNPAVTSIAPRATTKLFEALDLFLKVKAKEAEENSMRSYRSYISMFKTWLKDKDISEDAYVCAITYEVAMELMDDVDSRKDISPRTYNNYLMFFRMLFNWMIDHDFISDNPFDRIKRKPKKLTKKKRRILTDHELNMLFEYLGKNNPNYLCMSLLCYCCFLRPKEIVSLKCNDIDLIKQVVHIRSEIAKNDNDSFRTIPDVIVPILRNLELSNGGLYLFSGSGSDTPYEFSPGRTQVCSRKIAKYWDTYVRPACGFNQDLQFYSLKDSGVTKMLTEKIPINLVQKQADHSSVAMTAIYVGGLPEANTELKKVNILPYGNEAI
ncbi:uncharacterized protein BN702_00949 [Bacteroides sp. CAG:545]|nr:uncharacterized protein BN702_00949 [Bacteroides sp. CAG:545]